MLYLNQSLPKIVFINVIEIDAKIPHQLHPHFILFINLKLKWSEHRDNQWGHRKKETGKISLVVSKDNGSGTNTPKHFKINTLCLEGARDGTAKIQTPLCEWSKDIRGGGRGEMRGLLIPMCHPVLSKRGRRWWAPIKKWNPLSLPKAAFGHRAVVLCVNTACSGPRAESPDVSREAGCGEALSARPALGRWWRGQESRPAWGQEATSQNTSQPTVWAVTAVFSLGYCVSVQFTEFMTVLK